MKLFKDNGKSVPGAAGGGTHYTLPKRFGYVEIAAPGQPPYLKRWYLWRSKYFGVNLHHFLRPDIDPELHDHPWNFISFPLFGSYSELRVDGLLHRVRWFSRHRATDLHNVQILHRKKGVWTLFFTGRKTRTWGFLTASGWVSYEEFLGL